MISIEQVKRKKNELKGRKSVCKREKESEIKKTKRTYDGIVHIQV